MAESLPSFVGDQTRRREAPLSDGINVPLDLEDFEVTSTVVVGEVLEVEVRSLRGLPAITADPLTSSGTVAMSGASAIAAAALRPC